MTVKDYEMIFLLGSKEQNANFSQKARKITIFLVSSSMIFIIHQKTHTEYINKNKCYLTVKTVKKPKNFDSFLRLKLERFYYFCTMKANRPVLLR